MLPWIEHASVTSIGKIALPKKSSPKRFSNWQLRRLKSRLSAYRLNNGDNGEALSWLDLTQDILDCPATNLSIPKEDIELTVCDHAEAELPVRKQRRHKDDEGWPLRQEGLRRFVEETAEAEGAEKSMRRDRILAVRDFLLDVKYLYEVELEEPDLPHAWAYAMAEFCETKGYGLAAEPSWHREFCYYSEIDTKIGERMLAFSHGKDARILEVVESDSRFEATRKKFGDWDQNERERQFRSHTKYSGWGVLVGPDLIQITIYADDDNIDLNRTYYSHYVGLLESTAESLPISEIIAAPTAFAQEVVTAEQIAFEPNALTFIKTEDDHGW